MGPQTLTGGEKAVEEWLAISVYVEGARHVLEGVRLHHPDEEGEPPGELVEPLPFIGLDGLRILLLARSRRERTCRDAAEVAEHGDLGGAGAVRGERIRQ